MNPNERKKSTDKANLCLGILDSSNLTTEYHNLAMDTLMRIPEEVLGEICVLLDRIVLIRTSTHGGTEKIVFFCYAKHKMRRNDEIISITRKEGEKSRKSLKIPEPVRHETWIIFLVEDNLSKLTEKEKMAVIAEEFAHVYLKHDQYIPDGKPPDFKETEAKSLIQKWGFKKE